MSGEDLKEGLEGLTKIEGLADGLTDIMYWLIVVIIILFVGYLFSIAFCYYNKKKSGTLHADNDNYLGD